MRKFLRPLRKFASGKAWGMEACVEIQSRRLKAVGAPDFALHVGNLRNPAACPHFPEDSPI
jgi:hypothetical protein